MKKFQKCISFFMSLIFLLCNLTFYASAADDLPTIYIVGDSTGCDYAANADANYYYKRVGFGTALKSYVDTSKANVVNLALSGRSSKNFINEANYTTLTSNIKQGDLLLIAFGHNDAKADDATRYTNPVGGLDDTNSFKYSLYNNYIKVAQDAGATPILCSPIVRRSDKNDYTGSVIHQSNGGDYALRAKELAEELGIEFIDLTNLTKEKYTALTSAETVYLHAWTNSKDASVDNTHLNNYGAMWVAYMIAENSNALKSYLIANYSEPTKEKDLIVNPDYHEVETTDPIGDELKSSNWNVAREGWYGSAFGDLGTSGVKARGNIAEKEDGSVDLRAGIKNDDGTITTMGKIGGNGATDGMVMYYTPIGAGSNVEISGTITVNDYKTEDNSIMFGAIISDNMVVDTNIKEFYHYVAAAPYGITNGENASAGYMRDKTGVITAGSNKTGKAVVNGDEIKVDIIKQGNEFTVKYNDVVNKFTTEMEGFIYVGFFASRYADINIKDIVFNNEIVEGEDPSQFNAKVSIAGKEISLTKDDNGELSVSVPEGEGGTLKTETGAFVPCNVDLKNITIDDISVDGNAVIKDFNSQNSTLTLTIDNKDYIIELYMLGDVNSDKFVNVKDSQLIIQKNNAGITFTDKQEMIGDVDINDIANLTDVLYIISANRAEMTNAIYIPNAPLEGNDSCYSIDENGNASAVTDENVPDNDVTIEAVPSKGIIQAGEEFYVDFKIKNNPGFSGYSFTLKYNPDVVQPIKYNEATEYKKIDDLNSVSEVGYTTKGQRAAGIDAYEINNCIKDASNGEEYLVSLVNTGNSVAEGDGIMFRVPFRTISNGSANITLRERNGAFLTDSNSTGIQAYTKAASVTVNYIDPSEPVDPNNQECYYIDIDGNVSKFTGIVPDSDPLVEAVPSKDTVKTGDEFYVDFKIKNNPGFTGYSFTMKYDSNVIQPIKYDVDTESDKLDDLNKVIEVCYNSKGQRVAGIDAYDINSCIKEWQNEQYLAGLVNSANSTAVGDGIMFRMPFRAVSEGSSGVIISVFDKAFLIGSDRNPFTSYTKSGIITVDDSYIDPNPPAPDFSKDFEFENGVITKYKGSDENVNVPEEINNVSVQKIGEFAFYQKPIKSIVIPDSVSDIGAFSFFRCSDLESVTLSQNLNSIGEFAFFDCGSIKNLDIPEGVTSIGQFAFYSSGIQNINIPASVSSIGLLSFGGSSANVSVDENNPVYSSENSILYNKDKSTLIFAGGAPDSVVVPKSVSSIEPSAFSSCVEIKSVEIPKNVKSIAKNAFEYCDNVQLKVIKDSYAENFAKENDIDYISSLDPDKVHIFGDCNEDGVVDFNDASALLQKVLDDTVALDTKIKELFRLLDVNGDGVLNSIDVSLILKKAVNKDYKFPVEA